MTDVTRSSPKVLVTGAAGMLGSQLLLDAPAGRTAVGTDLQPAREGNPAVEAVGYDLAEPAQVERLFAEHGPFEGVIRAAAYTAVDQAESEEALAHKVNASGAAKSSTSVLHSPSAVACLPTGAIPGQWAHPCFFWLGGDRHSDSPAPCDTPGVHSTRTPAWHS